jgi:hypothetical protein
MRDGTEQLVTATSSASSWPEFSRAAQEQGVASSLSLPLYDESGPLGAFNVYRCEEGVFPDQDRNVIAATSSLVAVVLALAGARVLAQQLKQAMETRATIEQAKGIVMNQSGATPDEAFAILRKASQRENQPLRDIARLLVERRIDHPQPAPLPRPSRRRSRELTAATRFEDEALLHEAAASFFERRGFPRPTAYHRLLADAAAHAADVERRRPHRSSAPGQRVDDDELGR